MILRILQVSILGFTLMLQGSLAWGDPLNDFLSSASCNDAKNTCIGSAVCISLSPIVAFIPGASLAAIGLCSYMLHETQCYCTTNCSNTGCVSNNSSGGYCTPPGSAQAIVDPSIAQQCCSPPSYSTPLNPYPTTNPNCLSVPAPYSTNLPVLVGVSIGNGIGELKKAGLLGSISPTTISSATPESGNNQSLLPNTSAASSGGSSGGTGTNPLSSLGSLFLAAGQQQGEVRGVTAAVGVEREEIH